MPLDFDGSTDGLALTSAAICGDLTDCCWGCWIFIDAGNSGTPVLFGDHDTDANQPFRRLNIEDATARTVAISHRSTTGGRKKGIAANTYTESTWQSVVGGLNTTSDHFLVLNGDWANRGTNADTHTFSAGAMDQTTIGHSIQSSVRGNFVNAKLAWCCAWSPALTQNGIDAFANGVNPLRIRPADQLVAWRCSGETTLTSGADWRGSNLASDIGTPTAFASGPPVDPYARAWWGSVPLIGVAAPGGRIMGSLAGAGGLAGHGGIAGKSGGLAA